MENVKNLAEKQEVTVNPFQVIIVDDSHDAVHLVLGISDERMKELQAKGIACHEKMKEKDSGTITEEMVLITEGCENTNEVAFAAFSYFKAKHKAEMAMLEMRVMLSQMRGGGIQFP